MRHLLSLAVALGALAAGGAVAKPAERWAHHPSHQQLVAALPAAEQSGALDGRVVMSCAPAAERRLTDCRIEHETPRGHGYGAALLSLASAYELTPEAAKALRPGLRITVSEDWFDFDTPPDWRRKPTAQQLITVWPTKAWSQGLGGKAVINCLVSTQGGIVDCFIMSEAPAEMHFGDAAIALTPQFLMKPAMRRGVPVQSSVNIPINFEFPGGSLRREAPLSTVGSRVTLSPSQAWAEAPTYAQVAAAYPAAARAQKVGGHVALDCGVRKDGRLTGCNVISEEPKGLGLGASARDLSKQFRAEPRAPGHEPGSVQLPVTFDPAMLASGQAVVGKPQWISLPSAEVLGKAFAAVSAGGSTMLGCTVAAGGGLEGCTVESETPAGTGLGAAALSLVATFRLSTWTNEGLPTVGAHIRVPLRYDLTIRDAPPATPAAKP